MSRGPKVRGQTSYMSWRRKIGLEDSSFYEPDFNWKKQSVQDVDCIEWRFDEDGNRRLAGIIEHTCIPLELTDDQRPRYLKEIVKRWRGKGQPAGVKWLMDRLDCKAWVVGYEMIFTRAWVYSLDMDDGHWDEMELDQYTQWLKEL